MEPKIITIAQQKGGAGKTTIAAHIALAFSQKGKRVAAIDIDPQASLSTWYNIREEKFGQGFTGLDFVSATGWRVNSEINRLKEEHDIIIIDSPPHTDTEAKTAIRAADIVIIPMQPSPTDLWASKATIELAEKEKKHIAILINRMSANSKLAKDIIAGLPYLLDNFLGNRVAFVSCLMEGKCVTETDPSSLAAKEIKAIVNEIEARFFAPASSAKKKSVKEIA
jgi:chromosome partitioning protein